MVSLVAHLFTVKRIWFQPFTADPDATLYIKGSGFGILFGRIYGSSRRQGELPQLHSKADPASKNYADPGEHPPFSPSPSTSRPVLVPSRRPNSHKKRWRGEKGTALFKEFFIFLYILTIWS
jgi:hypothetical protein